MKRKVSAEAIRLAIPALSLTVLLAAVYVDPAHVGAGLGRMLVQGMARDLIRRGGIRAVEAFGDLRGPGAGAVGGPPRCLPPADFLGSVGFKTHRLHGSQPRMRMELRSVLTWRDEVEAALDRLRGVVRPAPQPVRPPSRSATRTGR